MQEVDLQGALEVLSRGQILIYPTETCYGLGVDPSQAEALKCLLELKGRDAHQPISLLMPSMEAMWQQTGEVAPVVQELAEKFLPGPLTLVLPVEKTWPPPIANAQGEVGFRLSSHPLAQNLMARWAQPLTTTSANPAGAPSAHRLEEIEKYFGSETGVFLLSGGDLPDSKGSTVLRWTGSGLQLLRQGDIALDAYV